MSYNVHKSDLNIEEYPNNGLNLC